jgi:hypothetical protein
VAPVLARTRDNEEIIPRVAACDIGKAELVCCVCVPDEDHPGRRLQEEESYSTMTRPLLSMADRLACLGVTRVVMKATSDYWKPVFYLLEAAGFETWLVNAKHVRASYQPRCVTWSHAGACTVPPICSADGACAVSSQVHRTG